MPVFKLTLRSEQYGGVSKITAEDAFFTLLGDSVFAGDGEVKIKSIHVGGNTVEVVRNIGDGTNFTMVVGVNVPDGKNTSIMTISNSQGGGQNPATSFVKVKGVTELSHSAAGDLKGIVTF